MVTAATSVGQNAAFNLVWSHPEYTQFSRSLLLEIICCSSLLFAMVLYLGTWDWILSTNGERSKSLFISALVSEGHKKCAWPPRWDTCVRWHRSKESPFGSFHLLRCSKGHLCPPGAFTLCFLLYIILSYQPKAKNRKERKNARLSLSSEINGMIPSIILPV